MFWKLRKGVEILRGDGLLMLGIRVLRHYLEKPVIAPWSRRLLGKTLHEKIKSYPSLGYWPNIRNPRTFNEKTLNRMLFGNDELYTIVHNKFTARDYVSMRIGKHVLPELYHVTDTIETIPFDTLPSTYVVKSSLGSGDFLIVDQDDSINIEDIKTQCKDWLSKNYYHDLVIIGGNYCYNDFDPEILIEERLTGYRSDVPMDYKFFVFHGQVEYIQVDFDRFDDHTRRFFDAEWNPLRIHSKYPLADPIKQPTQFEEMKSIAQRLGEDFDFIRVDLYQTDDDRIIVGELTVGPGNGKLPFVPLDFDFESGSLW